MGPVEDTDFLFLEGLDVIGKFNVEFTRFQRQAVGQG